MPNSVSSNGSSPYRGRKTGPKPSFSIDDAIKSALEVGLEQFTLAEVSKKLGVSAPSLYRVVPSRDALVDRCMEYIASQFRPLNLDGSWEEVARDFVDGSWELMDAYPGTDHILFSHPGTLVHFQPRVQSLAGALREKGAPCAEEEIDFVVDFLTSTCAGTHLGMTALKATREANAQALDQVNHQVLRQARSEAIEKNSDFATATLDARGYLDKKVDFIIAGINAGFLSAR
ncbi:TetR/AcrR family transcriptional regulator [Corynebacterium sp. H113]|uniref:TetR/AcrR family transcriptional regulator n=1 Tax=Corynebacterium sp. H113 TaxID=3133419 RepID=UPI0030A6AA37